MRKITKVISGIMVGVCFLTVGCSTQDAAKEIPAPTSTTAYPALISSNVQKVITEVNQAVAAGNQANSADQLQNRVSGPALTMLTAQYKLHEADNNFAVATFPSDSEVVTQTASTTWPKAIFNITKEDDSHVRYVQIIRQNTASEPYQLYQWMQMLPDASEDHKTTIPQTNVIAQGSDILANDQAGNLAASPNDAVNLWAQVALNAEDENAAKVVTDTQITQMRTEQKSLADAIGSSGKLAASVELSDPATVLAISLPNQKGALVTATYRYTTTLSDVSANKPVVLSGPVATLLGGEGRITEKASWTSLINVLFYVPAATSDSTEIQAVAAGQTMVEASK